ncbi:MAG: hypothetical protein ACKOVB_19790, partial [Terrabacter sp.]
MRRPTARAILAAVTPLALAPLLAGCSDAAASMPVAVPSTRGVATPSASATSDEPPAPAPEAAGGVTTTVTNERRDVAEGMPLGRVDLTRTSADGTMHDYIGVVQVGNVLLRLTWTSPDRKVANEK